jgi:hypothetical protein
LIISDPKHPENEGQVKLFKFGKKIFDKIMDKAQPTFADETPVNVFDYWDGADFKLRMKKVEGFPNYDSSVFSEPAPLGDDEEILKVVQNIIKLDEFVDPTKFKSYDELKAKYLSVMNESAPSDRAADKDDLPSAAAPAPARAAPAPAKPSKAAPAEASDDDDDSLAFFRGLAEED